MLLPISYRLQNFAALPIIASELRCYAEFYVVKIPRIRIGGVSLQQAVVLKWFYSLSRRKTFFVGGKCALPSALLVVRTTAKLMLIRRFLEVYSVKARLPIAESLTVGATRLLA